MKSCASCGELLADAARFCPSCGAPQAAATSDPLLGSIVAERYVLKERIGSGKSGVIYRAEHSALRSRFAIKLLHPGLSDDEAAIQRYQDEAKRLAQLDTDHIVKISDFGRADDNRLFFAMEYLEGETLDDVLARDGKMAEDDALELLESVAEAVADAHEVGIVHGDIRPRNVFLAKRKRRTVVKLLDFGLAKLTKGLKPSTGAAKDDKAGIADPRYMSPEQARGDDATQASDIYSLGLLGFALVNGKPPFEASSTFEILTKHIEAEPPLLQKVAPGTSVPYSKAVARALAKQPGQRFGSAESFVNAAAGEDTAPDDLANTEPIQKVPRDELAKGKISPAEVNAALARADKLPPDATIRDPAIVQAMKQAVGNGSEKLSRKEKKRRRRESSKHHKVVRSDGDDSQPAAKTAAAKPPRNAEAAQTALGHGFSSQDVRAMAQGGSAASAALARAAQKQTEPMAGAAPAKAAAPAAVRAATPAAAKVAPAAAVAAAAPAATKLAVAQPAVKPAAAAPAAAAPAAAKPAAAPAAAQPTAAKPAAAAPVAAPSAVSASQSQAPAARAEAAKSQPAMAAAQADSPLRKIKSAATEPFSDSDVLGSETGNWFAEGVAAEQALKTRTKSAPLPAIYDGEEDEIPRRRFSAGAIITMVIIGAALVLGVVIFAVTGGDGKKKKQAVVLASGSARAKGSGSAGASENSGSASAGSASAGSAAAAGSAGSAVGSGSAAPKPPENAGSALAATKKAPPAKKPKRKPVRKPVRRPKPTKFASVAPVRPPTRRRTKPKSKPKPTVNRAEATKHIKAGRAQLRRGGYSKARQEFTRALAINPRAAGAHGGLGEVAFEMGSFGKASGHLRRALRYSPRNSRYLVLLGHVYFKQGKMRSAITHYKRALRYNPRSSAARAGMNAAMRRLSN